MSEGRVRDAGLSLIEVLVSLAIFAVIGIAGLAVINTVARTGERTEGRLERLAEVDRAFLVIRRDLAQITVADVTLSDGVLWFGRAGDRQSVAIGYLLDDATLIRRIKGAAAPVDQFLLTGIAGVEWRLLDSTRRWRAVWPPVGQEAIGRPFAAELTLKIRRDTVSNAQSVTRLMVLPAGQGR